MSRIKNRLIFFDIDGTLILTKGAGREALKTTFRNEFKIEDPNVSIDYGGRTDRSIARELFQINGILEDESAYTRLFHSYLHELKNFLPRTNGEVLPGVLKLLKVLEGFAHFHLGLLTGNIEQGARIKLSHFAIDGFFKFGGFGDHHEQRNDIAKAGLTAAQSLLNQDFKGQEIIVIGDTPHDVTCSRAIGARCIAVSTGYAPIEALAAAEPEVILDDLTDVDRVLEIIES